ncbi:MAG: hypothetical protein CMJ78_03595 [Planctomycetaceae bacterium]|nr:hypothetical protein [Planctomycetaceae bacterium]
MFVALLAVPVEAQDAQPRTQEPIDNPVYRKLVFRQEVTKPTDGAITQQPLRKDLPEPKGHKFYTETYPTPVAPPSPTYGPGVYIPKQQAYSPYPSPPQSYSPILTKADHMLKAAEHLQKAGLLGEAETLKAKAEQLKQSEIISQKLQRLRHLEREIEELRKQYGFADSIRLSINVFEGDLKKLAKSRVDLSSLLQSEQKQSDQTIRLAAGTSKDIQTPDQAASLPIIQVLAAHGKVVKQITEYHKKGLLKATYQPIIETRSGRPIKFQSGGEFPVIVKKADGKVETIWRQFGFHLQATADSIGRRRVRLGLVPWLGKRGEKSPAGVASLDEWQVQTAADLEFGQVLAISARPFGSQQLLILVTPKKGGEAKKTAAPDSI